MEIKGKVLQMLPIESGTSKSGNEWQKASLIVEVAENPQYPKKVKISNMKNADAFSQIAIGTEVTFKVEIESREYNSRWYTEVSCWGWNIQQPITDHPLPQQQCEQAAAPQSQNDDLPF